MAFLKKTMQTNILNITQFFFTDLCPTTTTTITTNSQMQIRTSEKENGRPHSSPVRVLQTEGQVMPRLTDMEREVARADPLQEPRGGPTPR